MSIKSLIRKIFIRKSFVPMQTFEVILQDKYLNFMFDSDDVDDIPSYVKVTYDNNGNIINKLVCFGEAESSLDAQYHFFRTCHINPNGGLKEHKKYSMYYK